MSRKKTDIQDISFAVGSRIRIYRKSRLLTIRELSVMTGIPRSTLSEAETLGRDIASAKLAALVLNTDINPVWLLTGEGQMTLCETPMNFGCLLTPDVRSPPPETCELLRKAFDILTSGYSTAQALRNNIEDFHEHVRMKREREGSLPPDATSVGEHEARVGTGRGGSRGKEKAT
jgi:transcriptional regulator with XRE-family HTH domain